CYFSSDGSVPRLIDSHHELAKDHIKLTIYANVYYITAEEIRAKFAAGHRHLITQLQYNNGVVIKRTNSITNAFHTMPLPFAKPVTELFWVVQPEEHLCKRDFFNWSGLNKDDPIEKVKITVGNRIHMSEREGKWCRTMEPREH